MASPITPRPLSITPGSRVLQSPLSDDTIWKRLKEAGFDEESIRRRDKAALIAYIAKLEAELFDHQHQMGLLLLERKELASKCEQIKASAEATEIMHKREQAAHLSALAEARKREEGLKKALGVEKECIASIEKALHEMRAESAETKVTAESKLAEARSMVEDAQKKVLEAEAKLRTAESLQAEATRFHRTAERKLREVEAREDDLCRRITSFKADCDVKEKEIMLERQSLSERQKILQQEHERLIEGQASLNQREEYIFSRSQELKRLEKELEALRASFEEDQRVLKDEKSKLDLALASLSKREEAIVEREALLDKKERELLASQEKLANMESDEVRKVTANQEAALRMRKLEFEAELQSKSKATDDEIETKRRAWELREMDLSQRQELLHEKEHDLEIQSRNLADKEKDVVERSNLLDDREKNLSDSEKEIELKKTLLEKEKEEINRMKLELETSMSSLEDKKNQVHFAKEKLETMKSETSELSVLEMKLKEELDVVRAQKLELLAEADKLQVEKAKFETEWELIDEKREELRKEAERVAEERKAVSNLLKDERENLRKERDAIRAQYNHDVESLNSERENFMKQMMHEHSEWFSKIQQERADFLLGFETQKTELENCIEKRREELESYLREREEAFEQEKKNELENINILKEKAEKELEQVAIEMKRLDAERMEIQLDRERREREWAELNNSIEELKVQRNKLKQQRELLHADRKEINAEIEELKKLGDMKIALDNMTLAQLRHSVLESGRQQVYGRRNLKQPTGVENAVFESRENTNITDNGHRFNSPMSQPAATSSPSSARFSWIKRCGELIFKHSAEKPQGKPEERPLISDHEDVGLASLEKLSSDEYEGLKYRVSRRPPVGFDGEPKVIVEVPSEGGVVKGFRAKNKRKVDDTPPLVDRPNNGKKRREQNEAPVNKEEAIIHSLISSEPLVLKDQPVLMSSNQSGGDADEIDVLVIDKVTKVSEVPEEKADIDAFSDLENIEHLQELGVESLRDIPRGRGTDSHANAANGGNDGSEEQESHSANFCHVSEHCQSLEDIPEMSKERVQEDVVGQPNDNEKIDTRTIS